MVEVSKSHKLERTKPGQSTSRGWKIPHRESPEQLRSSDRKGVNRAPRNSPAHSTDQLQWTVARDVDFGLIGHVQRSAQAISRLEVANDRKSVRLTDHQLGNLASIGYSLHN